MAAADVFLQWKGTDVCLDFHCYNCQTFAHFDGFFASFLKSINWGIATTAKIAMSNVTMTISISVKPRVDFFLMRPLS